MTEAIYVFTLFLAGLAGAICFAGRLFADSVIALGFVAMYVAILVPIVLSSLDRKE